MAKTADAALQYAIAQLGKAYKFGGAGASAFDCSGLTMMAFKQVGIKLPHKAAYQQELGYEVGLGAAQPGDLVFFSGGPTAVTNKNGLNIGHVGIYVGNGYILEAYSSKDHVRIRAIGNRSSRVVSVKRLVSPVSNQIVVPGSPFVPSTGPQAQAYTIPGTASTLLPSVQGSGPLVHPATFTSNEVPGKPRKTSYNYNGATVTITDPDYQPATFTDNEVPPQVGKAPYQPLTQWTGGRLSDDQLVQVLATAGFQGEELVTAFAIARRESGGDPGQLNPNAKTKDLSYGLFQINMLGNMGPARRAQFGLSSNDDLYDPLTNAKIAYQMAHAKNIPFYDWGPYKGRAATYGTDLPAARKAVSAAIQNGVINVPWGGDGTTYVDASQSGPEAAAATANEDPATTARRLFGYMAAFLDDPEIGPILVEAAAQGWDEATLQGALFNQLGPDGTIESNWWHRTQASARQWDANSKLDPATAEGQVKATATHIVDMAQQTGVSLSPDRVRQLALDSLRFGWTDAQLSDALGAEILRDPSLVTAVTEGRAGRQVGSIAFNYGVNLSDDAKRQWSSQIAAGQSTYDDFTRYVVGQTKGQFNSVDLSAALDRGVTVRQYADPYITLAANTLGLTSDEINLTDPKWMKSIAFVDDKGTRRPMNLDEWGRTLRRDPVYGYGTTDQAKQNAYSTVAALGRIFGRA